MLKIAQVHRVEVGRPEAFAGPKARKLLEDFLEKIDKLETDAQDFSEAARRPGPFARTTSMRRASSREVPARPLSLWPGYAQGRTSRIRLIGLRPR
jgi:hypothetical protein